MASDTNEQIRIRAHQIWEEEGQPHGQHDEHWARAEREIGDATRAAPVDPHPGMMGDGTEEQNLSQPGNPKARITQQEVEDAFKSDPSAKKKPSR